MHRLLWISLLFFGCEAEQPEVIEGEIIEIDEKKNDSDQQNNQEQTDEIQDDQADTIDIHIEEDLDDEYCYITNIRNTGKVAIEWEVNINTTNVVSTVFNAQLIEQTADTVTFIGDETNYFLLPDEETQFDYCIK